MWEGHRRQSQPVRRTPKEFSIEAASGLLNCDRRKNSSFSTVSAQSGSARSSKAWRSTCAHKGAGCELVSDGCVGIVGPKIGLVVNAASGQSCCRFFCARLAPADGARVGRRDYISRKGSSVASLPDCDRKFERVTPTSRTPFGGGNTDRIRSRAS